MNENDGSINIPPNISTSKKLKLNHDLSNICNGSINQIHPSQLNTRQRSNEFTNNNTNTTYKNNNSQYNDTIQKTEESIDETEKEAIELLKLQHEQIKKYKKELILKDEKINKLNQEISFLNNKIKTNNENSIINLKNELELNNKEKNELIIELENKEKLIYELQRAVESLTKKFNDINDDLNSVVRSNNSEKMSLLINKAKQSNKEKQMYENKINLYEKEINKLNKNLKKEIQLRQKIEIIYNDKIKDEKNWINLINKDINLIIQWIENYVGVYFDKSITIPPIPCFTPPMTQENNKNFYEGVNFNKLRQEIFDVRLKISDKQFMYESDIEKYKKEQIDLIDNINRLNKDINGLNNEVLGLREEVNKKNIELDMIKNQRNRFNV